MGVDGKCHAHSTLPPGKRHGTYGTGGWVGLRDRKKVLPQPIEDGSWTFPRKLLPVYQSTRRERA